ncbi:hypothetical protein CFC21_087356 [Triticum aestivum]|uniref:Helicase C-terminal domain-containing protein n=3 Tax=Triticum TaxID=4564 RepID=A0A9R0YJ25_TRITD|nr:hypothetical protein CFC21_087356 [Triticum aestivum]VAI55381.1 unnamed protein product [Triticum turgidum subsp. durum]
MEHRQGRDDHEGVQVVGFEVPSSPDSSYSNPIPGNKDEAREPPLVPPHLQHILLSFPPSHDDGRSLHLPSPTLYCSLQHPMRNQGLHHGGLNVRDRSLVEELFSNNKIQVLICTSTLAWGVNLPSHLFIIKGTEYYGEKTKRYVDYVITDILQMMGRAGRPQYDQHGKVVILVHEPQLL